MLTGIELKNFKVFDNLNLNLTDKKGKPLKYIFFYGENGAGKSSVLKAISFLSDSLTTLTTLEHIEELISHIESSEKEMSDLSVNNFLSHFKIRQTVDDMAKRFRMIDSSDNMVLNYNFLVNDKKATYELVFDDNNELIKESFYCVLEKRISNIFTFTKNKCIINRTFFKTSKYKNELLNLQKRYWGKHTFASILVKQMEDNNPDYMPGQINEAALDVFSKLVRQLIGHQKDVSSGVGQIYASPFEGINDVDEGEILTNDKNTLDLVESYLKEMLIKINPTIKDVYYEKKIIEEKIRYSLRIVRRISGKNRIIPYSKESYGIKKIIQMFPYLIQFIRGNICIMDEIDSGIHDLLFQNLIVDMMTNNSSQQFGQLIASTHNTKIIHTLDANSTFLIMVDEKSGNREIKSFAELEPNHRSDNNYELKYLSDKYGGLPPKFDLNYLKMLGNN